MKKQRGATLAITLLMLLIVTLLAISSIQVTQMQEKMSANLQDKELSFHAAESALAAGEDWILNQPSEPPVTSSCSAYPCVITFMNNTDFSTQSASWWQNNSAPYSSTLGNIASSPRFIIEFTQYVPDTPAIGSLTASGGVNYYQVTARGTGGTDEAVTILQTTVARRF